MPRITPPSSVQSLKEARYWSLEWIKENDIQGPFNYVILQKAEDGSYIVHGEYATATEAFDDRRLLVDELGTRSLFLRAVRLSPERPRYYVENEDIDLWRDALASGDDSIIPTAQLPAFRQWAARANIPY